MVVVMLKDVFKGTITIQNTSAQDKSEDNTYKTLIKVIFLIKSYNQPESSGSLW